MILTFNKIKKYVTIITKEVASIISYGKSIMPKTLSYKLLQGILWMTGKTGIKEFFYAF